MNSLKTMYGCGLNFFIKLAYNSLFLYKFASIESVRASIKRIRKYTDKQTTNDVTVKQYTKQYEELPRGCA